MSDENDWLDIFFIPAEDRPTKPNPQPIINIVNDEPADYVPPPVINIPHVLIGDKNKSD